MGASLATAFTGAKADKVLEKVANGAARARGAEQAIRNHDYLGAAATLAGLAAEVTDGKAKERLEAWSGRLSEVGQAYRAAAGGDFLGAASTLSRLADSSAWDAGTKLDLGKAAEVFDRARGLVGAIRSKDYAGAAALAAEVGVTLAQGSKGQDHWGRLAEALREYAPLPGLIASGDYAGAAAVLTRIVQERQQAMGRPRAERPLEGLPARDVERMAGEIEAALAAGDAARADAVLAAAADRPQAPPATPYEVQTGDTLSGIAKRAGVTLPEVLKLNPEITNPDRIFVGQVIRLPAGVTLAPPVAGSPSKASGGTTPSAGSGVSSTDVQRAVDEVIGLLDDWTRGPQEGRILEIVRGLPAPRVQGFLDALDQRGYLKKLFADVDGANYKALLQVLEEKGARAGLDETMLGQVLRGILGGGADFGTGFVEGIAALFKTQTYVGLADLAKTLYLAGDPYGVVRMFAPAAHREAVGKLKQMVQSVRDQMAADWRAAKAQGKEAEIVARWSTQGVLEVASFFVGAGEIKAALNTTRLGAKLVASLNRVMGLVSRVGGWDRVGSLLRRTHPERAEEILGALRKYADTGDEAALARLSEKDLDELARALDADLASPRIGAGRALVLDDAAEEYARLVNADKNWSWQKNVTGGADLTAAEKAAIKQRAVQLGLIPDVPCKPGTRFPDFDAAGALDRAESLPEWLWKATDKDQFDWLDAKIGGRPPGMTWHHSEIPGRMELVPFGIHNVTSHSGGRAPGMWAEAPRR
jgi:LysM repeat protein